MASAETEAAVEVRTRIAASPETIAVAAAGEAPEGHPGHVTFYVQVDDIEASLAKAEQLGGKRLMGPMDIPSGQIALFADPEGHEIGLMTRMG